MLIGKDTRISGYMFESALQAGLSAAGVDIRLLGPIPTPGIAFLTQTTGAQAGIVVSASHNPHGDNGIKFFAGDGTKLADRVELAIEAELDQPLQVVAPEKLGKVRRMTDAARRYIEFCKSRLAAPDLKGIRICVDCAHGAGYNIAPRVFEELGATVRAIGAEPDGLNINDGFGATSPQNLQRAVLESGADLGAALDGDGDRLILIDHAGEVVDGDEALYIIAREQPETLNGGVVGTQMSNLGLERAIRALNLDFHRARVGDRYIMEMLREKGLKLGGETSGHIINLDCAGTGDGIISAIQVLGIMRRSGRSLAELKLGMEKCPQKLVNIRLTRSGDPSGLPEIQAAVEDARRELGQHGRVLLRTSGTEPLFRIMVEAEDAGELDRISAMLADRVEAALKADESAMPELLKRAGN